MDQPGVLIQGRRERGCGDEGERESEECEGEPREEDENEGETRQQERMSDVAAQKQSDIRDERGEKRERERRV